MNPADELPKTYDPASCEARWYERWEQAGYFRPRVDPTAGRPFCVMIPPPNVTGSLHVGHALNNTLQDILVRWRRMEGDDVLWQPGTDHAGIATQNVVERQLAAEKKTRHDLGRDAFVERVWRWKAESGGAITRQLRRLGASCDWSRERFTMDEGLSAAVRQAFVTLHREGLVERDMALIHWCPRCQTALSDLEVEHEEANGKLYHLRYPYADGAGHVTVATTRPETMLGDTAVAVHPDDERYAVALRAKRSLRLPLVDRVIPLIDDPYVDRAFGSGAVKITPAHDPNDFEVGNRHKLPRVAIFDDRARVNENGGPYRGLDRFEARARVLADLEAAELLEKVEDHAMSVGHCQRCRTVVEPHLSPQWFVRTRPLAAVAIEAVKSGRTRFVPESWTATYYHWMESIRDWCVSRQIWWGHQIPAWYCARCNPETVRQPPASAEGGPAAAPRIHAGAKAIVALEEPPACPDCGAGREALVRDPDVLDTWFSSATWPFSTLGWPERTKELARFYPTSTLVTAFDIIFFWVARMMMFGTHFMGEVPFREVYIHALVRDAKGEKMSKTKGNVLDPLVLMNKFGTDAVRFTLTAFAAQGRDVRLSEERIEGYRNFCNKLWNATRFLLMNVGDVSDGPLGTTLADRWILSRMQAVTEEVRTSLAEYRFNDAASALYQFAWHELCDWYLEMIKPVLYREHHAVRRDATRRTALHVLDRLFRLLHPIMPFLTEELWQRLPIRREAESVVVATFPTPDRSLIDADAEAEARILQETITALRNIRGEMGIKPGAKMPLLYLTRDAHAHALLSRERESLVDLAGLSDVTATLVGDAAVEAPKGAAAAVVGPVELFVPLAGLVDPAAESQRLEKELAKLAKDQHVVSHKLGNADYVKRAPAEVVEKDRARLQEIEGVRAKLAANLARVRELTGA